MNVEAKTQSSPAYGDIDSPVVVVGQSLCGPCMKKQQPFYGGSGKHLDRALERAGLRKEMIYTTNVVHCHPEKNVASTREWIDNCAPYLREELAIVQPRVAVGFGDDAHDALRQIFPNSTELTWPPRAVAGSAPRRGQSPALLFPPHPGSFRWIPTADGKRARAVEEWESCLARVFAWSFDLEPTWSR
ncbi:uracil-DNA glycosylase family protein [Candidatus Mycobacterium wuenschmannii]